MNALVFLLFSACAWAQQTAQVDRGSGTTYVNTQMTNVQSMTALGMNASGDVKPILIDDNGNLFITNAISSPLHVVDDTLIADFDAWKIWADVNLSTRASAVNQTNGSQLTQIVQGGLASSVKVISVGPVGSDNGLVANAVIYGLTTGGGGGYVEVKVNPSGSLVADVSGSTVSATQGTSPWVSNVSQFGGSNVVTGTGASGAGIPRVTVSNDSNILATQSGGWTVTANAGTNLNTSLLQLDTTGAKLNNAQGSTTSGQTGPLVQGAVTTAAPNYVTAQTSPLSMTAAGGLRTDTSTIAGTTTVTAGVAGLQAVGGNAASSSADSGNPVKVGHVYNSTLPTPSSGNRVDAQTNAFGELACRSRNKFLNIVGNVTTTVKSGAGVLHNICFNNGANSTVLTIYDNTAASGTKIGTPAILGINTNVLTCLHYDLEFSTGLTIVAAGSTANDITVTYQ
jgi:hypothetical protein